MTDKLFTREEAEELIPQLEQIIENLMESRKGAMLVAEELTMMQSRMHMGNEKSIEASDLINKKTELDFLLKLIQEALDTIENLGAQPKDLEQGLVDFPAVIDGEPVYLCWKYGEKSIRHYHGRLEGFANRKPLIKGKLAGPIRE